MPAWIPFAEVQRQYAALEERLAVISTHCLDTRRFGRGRDIAYGFFGWLYPDFVRIVTQPQFEKDFLYLTVPLTEQGYIIARDGDVYYVWNSHTVNGRTYKVKRHLATGQYSCDCPDSSDQGNIWCKHRVAVTAICPLLEGEKL